MLISIGQPKTAATRINDLPASTAVLPLIEITGLLAFISLAAVSYTHLTLPTKRIV